jgi:hypothetical protein
VDLIIPEVVRAVADADKNAIVKAAETTTAAEAVGNHQTSQLKPGNIRAFFIFGRSLRDNSINFIRILREYHE